MREFRNRSIFDEVVGESRVSFFDSRGIYCCSGTITTNPCGLFQAVLCECVCKKSFEVRSRDHNDKVLLAHELGSTSTKMTS